MRRTVRADGRDPSQLPPAGQVAKLGIGEDAHRLDPDRLEPSPLEEGAVLALYHVGATSPDRTAEVARDGSWRNEGLSPGWFGGVRAWAPGKNVARGYVAVESGSVSVPLSSLFVLGFWAVLGSPLFLPFAAGFLAGYLLYDMTHYHLHHHKPKTWVGRRLRELHMRHHFQDDTVGFGISAPYWDKVFRTFSRTA